MSNMKENLKELLLKDLCGRLPYGVICKGAYEEYDDNDELILIETEGVILGIFYPGRECIVNIGLIDKCPLKTIKPYLRPMSSMTEEEMDEYLDIVIPVDNGKGIVEEEKVSRIIDFYYSHHIDYRGLIEKGLALEAPKGMYKEI